MADEISMPKDLSEASLRDWIHELYCVGINPWGHMARGVLALVEAKVRDGVAGGYAEGYRDHRDRDFTFDSDEQRHIDETVARVMNKEATNG